MTTQTYPAYTSTLGGGATAAKQDTQTALLTTIDTDTGNIDTKLGSTNTKLDTLIAKDYSTSAKQDTTNTKLDTLIAKDFSTSAKQDTTNTKLDTLIAKDYATSAKQDTGNTSLSSIDTKLTSQATAANQTATNTKLDTIISSTNHLNVVDQIDTTPLLDTSSTNIPASASNPQQVVASLASAVKKIVSVEDIGEFIGVYTGIALSETLLCVLPLGGGEIEVSIPASTRISLRNMKNAAISSGMIALNFLG